MTVRATLTQAEIKRRIRAVLDSGLRVKGIAPDGTVLVGGGETPEMQPGISPTDEARWAEVKA